MKKIKDNCKDLNLRQTAKYLKKHNNYIILTHASPDGDTLGSAFALYYALMEIGKTASVLCPDDIPKKYNYFACETGSISKENATIVAVDVADAKLLGRLEDEFGKSVDLCIDHHISNTRYAKNLFLQPDAAATAESMFEVITQMKVDINNTAAKALYTGIVTDTGCFKYTAVTKKTHLIAAQLHEFDINASEINRIMFDTKSRKLMELESMVLKTSEYHFDGKCFLLNVTADMQKKTGCSGTDLEGIAVISRCVEGVMAGVTIKQTGDTEFKVSVRTYPPVDASEICKNLGGGGHKNAAGATLNGSLDEVKAQILNEVEKALEGTYAGNNTAK